jgi:hypothetical protein
MQIEKRGHNKGDQNNLNQEAVLEKAPVGSTKQMLGADEKL